MEQKLKIFSNLPPSTVREGCRSRAQAAYIVSTDVLMAALTSGCQERTARQFTALGAEVGLRLVRTFALASGDVAHDLRCASHRLRE